MDCGREQLLVVRIADYQEEIAWLSLHASRSGYLLLVGFSFENPAWFERHFDCQFALNDRALLYSFGLQLREGLGTVPRNDYAFAQQGSSRRTRCCFFFRIPDFFLPQHAKRAGSLLLWFAYRRIP